MRKLFLSSVFALIMVLPAFSQLATENKLFISTDPVKGSFAIFQDGKVSPLLVSSADWPGVVRAFKDLSSDLGKVTGITPQVLFDRHSRTGELIIAGTIGKSPLIDRLVKRKKINVSDVAGKWESYLIQVVKHPLPGVKRALVIAGSDKRGTIYGIYEVSKQAGVSPWYWWADVPVTEKQALYALNGRHVFGSPSVKYRGIFLNDEAPDLTNWVRAKYGTAKLSDEPPVPRGVANYGREFYTRLFELLLRLRGNYLWPAMWNNAFNEDDPENPRLADEYGIVMGNSHQEPMLRAQKEWDRRYIKKIGTWNYAKHPEILEAFWREGIRRNKDFESIVTIGLRGANDTEMAPGGPEANMAMLERIVSVQRQILTEETGRSITDIPQLWCLYKEVQDYYRAGMRVPDDVTLLWAEDNWGNIRRLPSEEERKRSGGAGIYYHFDYHGGPRSYQWLNTSPISKIWDQMSLAKQYGADRIWIVNAGHFKGYEFPVEFFLDLGWNTDLYNGENLDDFTRRWAQREFGTEHADSIADFIAKYTKFNGRRKPELLSPSTYSILNYREAERIATEYASLSQRAEKIFDRLPPESRDAYYQLVLFPIKACAIVNELYYTAGLNSLYMHQRRESTNFMAKRTRELFSTDTALMGYYNRDFAGGKWSHFMDQAHLGYTSWVDPPFNSLRAIKLSEVETPDAPMMGITIEGSGEVWPGGNGEPVLPGFDAFNRQSHYIDVYNAGRRPFEFTAEAGEDWIRLDRDKGPYGQDDRILVSIDWEKLPAGTHTGSVLISGTGSEVTVSLSAFNPPDRPDEKIPVFVEGDGYVSIEAGHFTARSDAPPRHWTLIEDYGHTLSAMRAFAPANAAPAKPLVDSPCLEYRIFVFDRREAEVSAIFAPTLNFIPERPLRYAISFDEAPPQEIILVPGSYNAQNRNTDWEKTVSDNMRKSRSVHKLGQKGYHTLKIWMIDPGVVLQKIVINTGGLRESYLGPPESYRISN